MPVINNVGITKNRISYNSYLICDEKSVLIDTVPFEYGSELVDKVKAVLNGRQLDYLILNHTEQDRSGAVESILEEYPQAVIIASIAGLKNLGYLVNRDFRQNVAKSNQILKIGEGITLRFLITHNINWPDSMMIYFEEEKVLFSCDAFSDEGKGLQEYYNENLSYLSSYVFQAMLMLGEVDINAIYPGNGTIINEPDTAVKQYVLWSSDIKSEDKKFAVIYDSISGNTEKAAKQIYEKLRGMNADAVILNLRNEDTETVLNTVYECDGIFFGSPTVYRNMTEKMRSVVTSLNHYKMAGKRFAAFGSYGWSGEAANLIYSYLRARHFDTFKAPVRFIFSPKKDETTELLKFTEEFFDSVTGK